MLNIRSNALFELNEEWFISAKSPLEKELLKELKDRWAAEENPYRVKWSPRKQPTGSWPILNKTGKLFKSVKINFDRKTGFTAQVLEYGVKHQFGRGTPQRQFLGISDTYLNKATEIICQKILKTKRL